MATPSPNGRYGNLFNTYVSPAGSGRWESPTPNWTPQSAGLPDWLARQFHQTTVNTGGDGGQDQTVWQVGNNGVYQDSSGANVVQVGDPSTWGQQNQPNLRDKSKVRYDEALGYVTDPSNLIDDFHENGWDRFMTHVAIPGIIAVAGGMAGAGIAGAAGAGAEGAGAGLAGDESAGLAMDGGLAGDESAGLSMANPFTSGDAGLLGSAGDESAGLSMANPFSGGSTGLLGGAPVTDLSVPANGGVGVTDLSVPAQSQGLLGQAGQWAMHNPLRALGLAQTAYGLLGGHGSTSGASSGSNGSSGSKGGNGSSANFTIPQQQFYVNPYIAAQIKRGYGQ